VYKRQSFTCQYCGQNPPAVTLEIDHINPVSRGGDNDINNLITACFDCNRGKRAIPLDRLPNTVKENYENLKEQELQLAEYNKLVRKINNRLKRDFKAVSDVYTSYFPGWVLNDRFRRVSLNQFFKKLTKAEIIDAMDIACSVVDHKDNSIRYFCGICWKKIKDSDNE
jgi:hypothetical protein